MWNLMHIDDDDSNNDDGIVADIDVVLQCYTLTKHTFQLAADDSDSE